MAAQSGRQQKVGDQIQRELAGLIQLELKDPRLGMVTVSGVDVSRDFAYADVFVTFLSANNDEDISTSVRVLNNASGFLRKHLGKMIRLRVTPQLRFHYDETLSQGRKISSLIDLALDDDKKRESE